MNGYIWFIAFILMAGSWNIFIVKLEDKTNHWLDATFTFMERGPLYFIAGLFSLTCAIILLGLLVMVLCLLCAYALTYAVNYLTGSLDYVSPW